MDILRQLRSVANENSRNIAKPNIGSDPSHYLEGKAAAEIDRLRAELAETQAVLRGYVLSGVVKDGRIAELEGLLAYGTDTDAYRRIRARAEQSEKRVGELEAALVLVREVNASLDARAEQIELANKEFGDQLAHAHVQLAEERARAEHAEARIAELEELRVTETHKWVIAETRAERAEAERDAIKSVLERVVAKCPKLEPVCIAAVGLTALNPSPAEKDIRC